MNEINSPFTFRSRPYDTDAVIGNFMSSIARYHGMACNNFDTVTRGGLFLLSDSDYDVEFIPLDDSVKLEPEDAQEGDMVAVSFSGMEKRKGFIAFLLRHPNLININLIPEQKDVIPMRLRHSIEKANECIQKNAIEQGLASGISFPQFGEHNWRSDWPYVITLQDGIRIAAYPAHGKIDDEQNFCIGADCQQPMWYVSDGIVEHDSIDVYNNAKIIQHQHVKQWEPLG